jgi:hypothetical protein
MVVDGSPSQVARRCAKEKNAEKEISVDYRPTAQTLCVGLVPSDRDISRPSQCSSLRTLPLRCAVGRWVHKRAPDSVCSVRRGGDLSTKSLG